MVTLDYDRVAIEYAHYRQVHPRVLESLLRTGEVDACSRVLEVGCGTGNYVAAVSAATGCMCWGIDPSPGMLTLAQEWLEPVDLRLGQAEQLDFPPGFLDLVFSVDVIHHVTDHRAYFAEAYRVLRAGGKLCTVTNSEWIIHHRQPLSTYFPETVPIELARYPAIAELRSAMDDVGFGQIGEEMVEFDYLLTSSRAYRQRAFSSLHLIADEPFQRGLTRLEQDLQRGPISCVLRYVLLWGTK